MAYLSNLQEPMQPATQGALFSWPDQHQKIGEKKFHSSESLTLQKILEFGHSASMSFSSPQGEVWRISANSATFTQVPLSYDFSKVEDVPSGLNSVFQSYLDLKGGEKKENHLTSLSSQSRIWNHVYNLILNLQDLSMVTQFWEARNLLVHGFSNLETWKNASSTTMVFHDILDARKALEGASALIGNSLVSQFQTLERLYVFRQPKEVSQFLIKYPFLISLVQEAYGSIRKHFPNSKLLLEVIADSEAIGEEQLVIFIETDLELDIASKNLDSFDDEWWLDALEKAQGMLCITLEFQ